MARTDLIIKQGKTFSRVLRWATDIPKYALISNIANSAGVSIVSTDHGIPNGWSVAISNVIGMKEINAENANKLKQSDFHKVSVIDSGSIVIPGINSTGFKPYISGGVLTYMTPVELGGYVGRFYIKDSVGGTVLHQGVPVINESLYTITLVISATDTALFSFQRGVYELEIEDAGGSVTQLMVGSISVEKEVAI